MTALIWEEGPIGEDHDRTASDCGEDSLNTYLTRYARQNHESGGTKCFVATPRDAPARILGFYTLSPASVEFSRAPAVVTRGLGRYEITVYRLGCLGVDRSSVQGRGLGGRLLLRAAERCMTVAQEVGGVALLIDAKCDYSAQWYESYGAAQLLDALLSLGLPIAMAIKALKQVKLGNDRNASRVQILTHSTPVDVGDTLSHNLIGRCQGRRAVHALVSLSSNARLRSTPQR